MRGPLRRLAFSAILAGSACTMIGSEELREPRPREERPGPLGVPRVDLSGSGAATTRPVERPDPPTAADLEALLDSPEPEPRAEPPSRGGNRSEYEQFGRTYRVLETSEGYDERGIASWYGEPFHGRQTSSGEVYDMYQLTAAHRTLPLPTYVEVTNLANGNRVVLRVTDRGPFHDPARRIIDVSYTAALKLGMVGTGTAPVRVRALEPYQVRVAR